MTIATYADEVRRQLSINFGDTLDLCEELVNTLTNIYYFAAKAKQQNLGGLSDLQDILPTKSEAELIETYMRHIAHVQSAVPQLPSVISSLREIMADDSELGEIFEGVTIDSFKYQIEDAVNKNDVQRNSERKNINPVEHAGLARLFDVPFRSH